MADVRLHGQQTERDLRALLEHYVHSLDARRFDELEVLLHEPAIIDLRPYGAVGAPRPKNPTDCRRSLENLLEHRTEHRVSSPRFTIDGRSALGQAHTRIRLGAGAAETLYGDLVCRFRRAAGRWLIERLDFDLVRRERGGAR